MGFYSDALSTYGGKAKAARACGIAISTFKDRLSRELIQLPTTTLTSDTHEMSFPVFPEDRPGIDTILERLGSDYEQKRHATDKKEWFEIKAKSNLPFGLMVWGDPHLDNPGTDIPLIRHHMRLAKHPSVFSINIGDTLDGWVGRLARLYGESRVDVHTARELACWFMREVRWMLWLAGNHDMWADNEAILRQMSKQHDVPLLSWQSKFKLVFPNSNEILVHAAHNFPGRSMHNIVHGNMRAARSTSPADLLLDGHLHDWGSSQFEMAAFNRVPLSIKVAGYKRIDSYANVNGYQSARYGSTCLVVIDPNMEGPGRLTPFWDVEQGIFTLDALISRYKAGERQHDASDTAVLPIRAPARTSAGRKRAVRRSGSKARGGAAGKPGARQGARSVARQQGRGRKGKVGTAGARRGKA